MMFLQIATGVSSELAYSNINLQTGSFVVIAVLSGVVVFLYKKHEDLYKRLEAKNDLFINELRSSNEKLASIVAGYNKFLDKVDMIADLLVESKK